MGIIFKLNIQVIIEDTNLKQNPQFENILFKKKII